MRQRVAVVPTILSPAYIDMLTGLFFPAVVNLPSPSKPTAVQKYSSTIYWAITLDESSNYKNARY